MTYLRLLICQSLNLGSSVSVCTLTLSVSLGLVKRLNSKLEDQQVAPTTYSLFWCITFSVLLTKAFTIEFSSLFFSHAFIVLRQTQKHWALCCLLTSYMEGAATFLNNPHSLSEKYTTHRYKK